MTKEKNKEEPSDLIYDLPKCFMMTWEELMDRTSTTTTGYDIWNKYQNPRTNKYPQVRGDTSNPKRTTKYP